MLNRQYLQVGWPIVSVIYFRSALMDPDSRLDVLRGKLKEPITSSSETEKPEEKVNIYEKKVQFQCDLCGLCEMCQYYGTSPPFVKNLLEFTEACYVMIDPFTPHQGKFANNFLVLGGDCDVCKVTVCVECSIFFTKRFCVKCAQFNINEFPQDVQSRLVKLADNFAKQKNS